MVKNKEKQAGNSHAHSFPEGDHYKEEDYSTQLFDYQHNPAWRIFRIMAEFVDGFNFLSRFKKTVTIFGSARVAKSSKYYKTARKLTKMLSDEGYTVISGGGPGIMEAANRGASEGKKGDSVGLNIQLPFEQRVNKYVKKAMAFNYFFTRKVMLAFSAKAYIFFPGGYGTLDEVFEMITLRQTHKIHPGIPIILVGRDHWGPLCKWLEESVQKKLRAINKKELSLLELVDSPEEAFDLIKKAKINNS